MLLSAGVAEASILFQFTESGGSVLMQASGTLNTANLVSVTPSGWGGVGVETNNSPESDIMGDTTMGGVDRAFGFNVGTDLSPWVGSMFTSSNFGWTSAGTTQFTTYYFTSGLRTPGIGIALNDMVGALWTPDNSWSKVGTFGTLGLTVGTYAISDSVTGESITIRIGDQVAEVPEPTSMSLMVIGACVAGIGAARRRRTS